MEKTYEGLQYLFMAAAIVVFIYAAIVAYDVINILYI